ncbi:MAG: hypothetical protein ACRDJ9_23535 [Dehalococcoidia bacterium]
MMTHKNPDRRPEQLDKRGASRRSVLLGGGAVLGGAAALLAGGIAAQGGQTLTVDVAMDGRTWRMTRLDPTQPDALAHRGDSFIVNGGIFPAGTIERGLTSPDQTGRIGTWVCRGTFQVEDIMTQTPHVASLQMFLLDGGNALISEGLEGGVTVTRAVIGGWGRYAGARGTSLEEPMGSNETLFDVGAAEVPSFNLRFTFTLI